MDTHRVSKVHRVPSQVAAVFPYRIHPASSEYVGLGQPHPVGASETPFRGCNLHAAPTERPPFTRSFELANIYARNRLNGYGTFIPSGTQAIPSELAT